jgi:5-methylcytosine-specific restriction protein A
MFEKGKIYNRRNDLHKHYGGQIQGGISTPSRHNFIMLFTSTTGAQYGYSDGWSNEGYLYTGEGQKGEMSFVRGNLAIRDHEKVGKSLHLFEYVSLGNVRYIGQMSYKSYIIKDAKDKDGYIRKIIVFILQPID